MAHEWTDTERRTVKEFAAWLNVTDNGRKRVRELLRVSGSVLSQMLTGTYPGRVAQICSDMRRVLRRERDRKRATPPPPYATTSVTQQVIRTMQIAQAERVITLVLAPSGIGKTVGLRRYCEAEPDTVYMVAGVQCRPWALMRRLAMVLEIEWRGSIYDMRCACADALSSAGRMLVVDEIDYVPEPTLQALRMIWDQAQLAGRPIGMVLSGTAAYLDKLRARKSATIRQVLRRFKHVTVVSGCSDDDIAQILSPFEIPDDVLDVIIEGAAGEAGRAVDVYVSAKRMSGEKPLTAAMIREAYGTLMPVEMGQ